MEKYLKDRKYYENLYDRYTVEECRSLEKRFTPDEEDLKKEIKDANGNEITREEKLGQFNRMQLVALYFLKGEKYVNREKTINEWMDRDKKRDEYFESAKPPALVRCVECITPMEVELKSLDLGLETPDRILFIFRCPSCRKGKGIYDNGEEYKHEDPCPRCNTNMIKTHERKEHTIKTTYSCPFCKHEYFDSYTLTVETEKKQNPDDEKQLAADKLRFCMSETEGQKYEDEKVRLESLKDVVDKIKEREENKDLYDKVNKIQKITIGEAKKMLGEEFVKNNFIDFNFEKPEIGRHVFVSFSTVDDKKGREEYDSKQELKRIIKNVLENTNWRLSSDGIQYRIGFLSGRLRVYETEKELIDLYKK